MSASGCGLWLPTLLKRDGTKADCAAERRRKTTPLITRLNLLPTLTVHGNYNAKGMSPKSGDGLATAVRRLPTLTASEHKYRLRGSSQQSRCLGAVARQEALEAGISGGQLNPEWCEWFMGWPVGWTESSGSATGRFRQWLRLHGM